jgi:ATPase family associated with various cellular activities (AAA)
VTADPSVRYLLDRLGLVEQRVRLVVADRRRVDPSPDDPFRGLYLSDEAVDRLLSGGHRAVPEHEAGRARRTEVERAADESERGGVRVRLRALARTFGLDELETELLVVALAPDLDSRFERLYGYLNDDVTRRLASVGLALEICGVASAAPPGRRCLAAGGALVDGGLVRVEDGDRPFLTRGLRVPDRVVAHLLGDDHPDPLIVEVLGDLPRPARSAPATAAGLAAALDDGVRLAYLHERLHGTGRALAAASLAATGRPAVVVDLERLAVAPGSAELARSVGREARLRGGVVVASPADALVDGGLTTLRALADLPAPVLLVGRVRWDPSWARDVPLLVEAPDLAAADRGEMWLAELDGHVQSGTRFDPGEATAHFSLGPDQVARAARAAVLQAAFDAEPVGPEHLRGGALAQNAAGLERLARRISPSVGWTDLVLPAQTADGLRELAARARHRERVLVEWAMRPGGGRGRGVTALFAGDSGTGKTMSAEVVAGDLGLDLYAVDLSAVVDKYVGETEKNLERIFREASEVNGVLLFDEADAIFGKRSEVRDAHDRYANIESAYLLQRMESFDGLAILSTNLRANLDDAFTRRLDMVVDFPMPDVVMRRVLWDRCLGSSVPRSDDLDLDFCATSFELAGGNIRSVVVSAAYLAADAGGSVTMAHLVKAVEQEYRKLGRLRLPHEFGPYLEALAGG